MEENINKSYVFGRRLNPYTYNEWDYEYYTKDDFMEKVQKASEDINHELLNKNRELMRLKSSLKKIRKRLFIRPALKGLIAGFWD